MVAGKAAGKVAEKVAGKAPQEGLTQRLPSGGPTPAASQRQTASPATAPPPGKAKSKSTTFHIKPGKGGDVRIVKTEFLVGFILLMLAPLANPDLHFDKNYAKRLIAFVLLFSGLFALADNRNTSVSRLASGFGGVLLLALAVYSPSNKFSIKFAQLLSTIVQRLQPK